MNKINTPFNLTTLNKGEKYLIKFDEVINNRIIETETIMEIEDLNQGHFKNCTTFKIINTNSNVFKTLEKNKQINYIPNTVLQLKFKHGTIFKQ